MQRFSAIPAAALSDRNLTDSEYRTLGAIALHADKDGWCWPSQGTIAELRDVSRQTIITHIKKLVRLGYVNVQKRTRPDGGQTSNYYQVKLDYPLSNPDFTGGVKSKTLQGVSNQDFTPPVKIELDTINTPDKHPNKTAIAKDEIGKKREAITALVEKWCKLTSKPVPISQQYARREYGEPAADFLERVGWNVESAYDQLHAARAEMLQRGMTPFKLSAVVPFAVARIDMHKQSTNGQHPPAKDREGMILEDDTGRFIIRNGKPERIEDDGPY